MLQGNCRAYNNPPAVTSVRESDTDTGQSFVDRFSACLLQTLHSVGRDQGSRGCGTHIPVCAHSTFSPLMAGTVKHDVESLSFGEEGITCRSRFTHQPATGQCLTHLLSNKTTVFGFVSLR